MRVKYLVIALFALALHRNIEADDRLYSLAKEVDGKLSDEAIFWLGEARGESGFEALRTVRRQSIWHHLSLFLRDTFLPVLSPV